VVRLALAFAMLAAVLAAPSVASACSMTALPGPKTMNPNAAVIFTGTAVGREDVGPMRLNFDMFLPVRWTFVVDGVEKGSAGNRTTVESEHAGGSCGVEFRLGQRYRVVVADAERMDAWAYDGTHQLDPLANPPPVEGDSRSWKSWIATVMVVTVVMLVLSVARRRRSVPSP
jgi:hypothetical protein